MIPVVTPHELLMALKPEVFVWEQKIITDFCVILERLEAPQLVESSNQAKLDLVEA